MSASYRQAACWPFFIRTWTRKARAFNSRSRSSLLVRRLHRRRPYGKQTKTFLSPEAHTDFIFAVISEEFGFIGAIIVIALFAVYGWRGLRAAFSARTVSAASSRSASLPWCFVRR